MTRKTALHLDEARSQLVADLRADWSNLGAQKLLVIEDAFGRFALGVWGEGLNGAMLNEILKRVAPYDAAVFCAADDFDPMDLNLSWDEAVAVDEDDPDTIRRIVRHRMLPAWQSIRPEPLWPATESSPLVAFYSFKGGMGRTTALAAFALDRVRRDEHVVVVDLDLDAPGLGSVLAPEAPPPCGVVDYLIERPVLGERPDDLLDVSTLVDLKSVRSSGSLRVLPAGRLDEHYLGKMARLDFEPAPAGLRHPLEDLLLQIRETWNPDWILLDSRTGFSETAGMLLSGLAHFHVLVGVDSEQSWQGLAYAVRKLGADRLRRGHPQAEVLLVQGLVPEARKDVRDALIQAFQEHATDLFREAYFAEDDDDRDDDYWYLDESGGSDAPDRTHPLGYASVLAQSVTITDLIDVLDAPSSGFPAFCETLARRAGGGDGS